MTHISQAVLLLAGIATAFMLTRERARIWRWTFATRPRVFYIGLIGQVAWLYDAWAHGQWGTFAIAVWWVYCYATGLRDYLRRRRQPLDGRTCR